MAEKFRYFSRKFKKKLNLEELLVKSATLEVFLKNVLRILAREFPANVASVYLWDEREEVLVLTATYGLNTKLERRVKLRLGEGLIGNAMLTHSPMAVAEASKNLLFRAIDNLGEEIYDAYLVVPVELSGDKMGVMVLQRKRKHPFTTDDLQVFKEISLAMIQHLQSAGLLIRLHEQEMGEERTSIGGGGGAQWAEKDAKGAVTQKGKTIVFTGKKAAVTTIQAASGIGVVRAKHISLNDFDEIIGTNVWTLVDFNKAVHQTQGQIRKLQVSLRAHLSEWAHNIFVGHLLILKDEAYTGKIRQHINEGMLVPLALIRVTRSFMRSFARSQVPSIREKVQDVKDLGVRILKNLLASDDEAKFMDLKGKILVTRDLYPSELMFLKYQGIKGVVQLAAINVLTSHMSLIAASLDLPYMITQDERILRVPAKEKILLDFVRERIYVHPSREIIRTCMARESQRVKVASDYKKHTQKLVYTKDGVSIKVLANVNLLEETKDLYQRGVDGIGLYRSEFPFMVRNTFPTENEQYYLYKRIIASMQGGEVAIRTLDVGGDKVLPYVDEHVLETNSILGLRAIRFTLKYREVFIDQLKAILRAAHGNGRVKIILPLISSLEEVLEAKKVLEEAKARLERLGEPYAKDYSLGIMIEVPSVIWILDELAREVDFFCIGTNDLVQYLLAVDRNNDMVAGFYSHHHPSVLRMVKAVITGAQRSNIECTLCGQMAEDLEMIPFLLGVGVRRFSVSLGNLMATKERIRQYTVTGAAILADQLLNAQCSQETQQILQQNAVS